MQDNKQTKIQNIDFSFPVPGECGRLRRSWPQAPGTHLFSCQHISRSEMVKHTCLIIHRWSPTIKHTAWSYNFAFINDSSKKKNPQLMIIEPTSTTSSVSESPASPLAAKDTCAEWTKVTLYAKLCPNTIKQYSWNLLPKRFVGCQTQFKMIFGRNMRVAKVMVIFSNEFY